MPASAESPHPLRRSSTALFAIFVVAIASYAWIFALPLTAIDTIPTIAAARADSLAEAFDVLGRELRGGVNPTEDYYRPLTLITYTLDYALWGWNPIGYHLTDLLLHGLAALAVFAMGRHAFRLAPAAAAIMTAVFLFHSVAIEVVPAITRRQEPLLVIGFTLVLIGGARLPRRSGWGLTVIGSLVTVTAVERGLVVPGILIAYLLILGQTGPDLRTRLRRSVLWSLPALAVAISYYAIRIALYGGGTINFVPRNLIDIPARFALDVVYPQQIIDVQMPNNAITAASWGIGGLAMLVVILAVLYRVGGLLRAIYAITFCGGFCLLFAIAGLGNTWYPYTAVPMLGMVLALLINGGWQLWHGPERSRLVGGAGVVAGSLILAPIVLTSPLVRIGEYHGWQRAGEISTKFLAELERVTTELPDGGSAVIVNLPGHFRESESHALITKSAAMFWPRSIRVWLDVQGIDEPVLCLGAGQFVGTVSAPSVELIGEDRLRVRFPGSPSSYADPTLRSVGHLPGEAEFPWPQPRFEHAKLFVFDGERLIPR